MDILSLDAYNRGYGVGISGLGGIGARIGQATIIEQSDTQEGKPGVEAGFYAVAYELDDGTKIISYRGTDNPSPLDASSDIWRGWTIGGGFIGSGSQAGLALEFHGTLAGWGLQPHPERF